MLTLLADDFSHFPFADSIGRAIAEGREAILLVPEQLALATEQTAARALPSYAPLAFEVSSFSRLADRVFRKEGGISFPYADRAAEIILMWKALDATAPFLLANQRIDKEGDALPKKQGAADTVKESLALLAEITTAGICAERLRTAAARLPATHAALKDKLTDLALLTDAYEGEREGIYGSLATDLARLAAILREKPDALRGETRALLPDGIPSDAHTEVYVSGFTSFTAGEYAVLGEIMRHAPLFISLSLPEEDAPSLAYREVEETKERLLQMANDMGTRVTLAPPVRRTRPPMLAYAKRMLFRRDGRILPYTGEDDGSLAFVLAKDPYEGCAHVAAEIARRVREGARYHDFTVLAREPEKYDGILDDALAAEGIPFFFSKNTDITELAVSKMILSALTAVERGFARADVIAYLKSGFTGISEADADLFEIYAETWRLKGAAFSHDVPFDMDPEGYVIHRSTKKRTATKERIAHLNALRLTLLSPLWSLAAATAGSRTAREHAEALYRFLSETDTERTLLLRAREAEVAGRKEDANRLARVFGVLCDLLDRIVDVMGEVALTRARFTELLTLLFSSVSLGTIPMLQDAVTVMSADLFRPTGEKTVFLLGVNEGEFPGGVSLGGVFPEEERLALKEQSLTVGKAPELRASREQYSFLRALAAPSERAVVIAFKNGAMGEAVRPATAFRLLHYERTAAEDQKGDYPDSLFPDVKEERDPPAAYAPASALLRFYETQGTAEGEALRLLLQDERRTVSDVPLFDPVATVSAETAARLFPSGMVTSQSAIEAYLDCPFAYYAKSVLRLSEDEPAAFRAREVGNIMHAVLESFFRTLADEGRSIRDVAPAEIEGYVTRAAERYVQRLCPPSLLASPRLSHLLFRVRRAALLVCRDLHDEFSLTRFEPLFYELGLDAQDGPGCLFFREDASDEADPPFSIGFRGIIDRVDAYRAPDGNLFLRVVDYKTGSRTFDRNDLEKARNLQMFVYLCAIWKSENPAFLSRLGVSDRKLLHPAGIVYNTVDPRAVTVKSPLTGDALTDSIRKSHLARNGFFLAEEDVVDAMDDHLAHTVFPRVKGTDKPDLAKDKFFASEERFGEMLDTAEAAVLALARRMRSGCADVAPDTEVNRCPTCPFRTVCRNENFEGKKY